MKWWQTFLPGSMHILTFLLLPLEVELGDFKDNRKPNAERESFYLAHRDQQGRESDFSNCQKSRTERTRAMKILWKSSSEPSKGVRNTGYTVRTGVACCSRKLLISL